MRLSLFAVAALLVSSLAARADTVYTYTGPNFTTATGPFTTSDSIKGTLTFTTPLAANLAFSNVTPSTFLFSDGVDSFTPANTMAGLSDTGFYISTDANGNIIAYTLRLTAGFNTAFSSTEGVIFSSASTGNGGANNSTMGGSFSPGVSTVAAVTPEPSSIALLGTGILGVFGVMKRRFA